MKLPISVTTLLHPTKTDNEVNLANTKIKNLAIQIQRNVVSKSFVTLKEIIEKIIIDRLRTPVESRLRIMVYSTVDEVLWLYYEASVVLSSWLFLSLEMTTSSI